ncbi:hypothetical protein IscW_ISCW014291 [Ixodes scapularis]|uniref:Uncharacterized protein n=1 Tax=Ixodes scapularis TaxID=6945 RepID=B7QIP6_IXOSC|nr:hypothetical protein IscW_ISCW014291 [Ixodes scapularis]|eukprot:XP_002415053.1 hypothetical protein IscW_ISCW014291 [Ixodes scapularis]
MLPFNKLRTNRLPSPASANGSGLTLAASVISSRSKYVCLRDAESLFRTPERKVEGSIPERSIFNEYLGCCS